MTNIKYEIISSCDLCGSKKNSIFLNTPDRNYETGNFNYIKCSDCSLVWLSPRPTQKSLFKFYPKTYGPYRRLRQPTGLQKLIRQLIGQNKIAAKLLIADPLFFYSNKGKLL